MDPIHVLLSETLCTNDITQIDPARTLFPTGDYKKYPVTGGGGGVAFSLNNEHQRLE